MDALTYLWSAACLLGIPGREPAPAPVPRGRLIHDIGTDLRYVLGHPVLRPILLEGACTNLAIQLTVTMLPVVFVLQLGFSGAVLGGFLASGGVGLLAGAMAARPIGGRLGQGLESRLKVIVRVPGGSAPSGRLQRCGGEVSRLIGRLERLLRWSRRAGCRPGRSE